MVTLHLATTEAGNRLLESDPLALLVGMQLDQQIQMEKAFTSPHVLAERMGTTRLDSQAIADCDPEEFEAMFRQVPALHRFPAAMATRVQELAKILVESYGGDAAAVWSDVDDGNVLVQRIAGLPGFGPQKARIFTALLGKQYGVQPEGWRQAAGSYGDEGSFRSAADVVDKDSLVKVRAFKKEQKAAAEAKT